MQGIVSLNSRLFFVIIPLFAGCYLLFISALRRYRRRWEKKEQLLFIEQQLSSARDLESEYRELRKWNHNISNHFLSLSYLLENGKCEESAAYIKTLLDKKE